MSWQSLLRLKDNMPVCIYTDAFIRIAKKLLELKQKRNEESKRNINTLYAQWEKLQQAEKSEKEYAAVQENIDVFPTPMMVEPLSIKDTAVSATDIKLIQMDQSSGSI